MPFLHVTTPGGTVTTNAGGTLGCVTGIVSTALQGRYTRINDMLRRGQRDRPRPATSTSASARRRLATDCAVPAGHSPGDTKAARTAFYELTRINEQARG